MAEYIDRDMFADKIREHLRCSNKGSVTEAAYAAILQDLEGLPTVDVAPVVHETPMLRIRPQRYEKYQEYGLNENGETLYLKQVFVDEKNWAMYCPRCGKRLCSRFRSFCPNCGAKMDGGEKENE